MVKRNHNIYKKADTVNSSIALLLIAVSVNAYTACYSKGQTTDNSNWVDCVGVLTRKVYGKSSVGEFEYEYKGNVIRSKSTNGISIYGAVVGEKYIVKVNAKSPEKYIPVEWKPVFTDEEDCDSTVGVVKKIKKFRFFCNDTTVATHMVTFTYIIDDEEYERSQVLPPLFKEKHLNFKEGNQYVVKYFIPNPQRAILVI